VDTAVWRQANRQQKLVDKSTAERTKEETFAPTLTENSRKLDEESSERRRAAPHTATQ
jgi:hypothetical protein